jgi:hypothetical protein
MNIIDGANIPLQAFVGDYNPRLFKPVENSISCLDKPSGGLWTSTYDENIGSDWLNFCVNGYWDYLYSYETSEVKRSAVITLIKVKKGAKFILIDSYDDLDAMMKEYGNVESACRPMFAAITTLPSIDFVAMSKTFGGIYLTSRGQSETRFSLPYTLRGWDVESVIFFDPDGFDVVRKMKCSREWLER